MVEGETIDPSQPQSSNELILTQTARFYLTQISKWTKFLSILGFIVALLMLVLGLAFGTQMGTITTYQYGKPISEPFVPYWGFFYIFLAVFCFFASLYLYQFGKKVKKGILFQDPLQVEKGFSKLRSLFKMLGIATIIYLVIIVIFIVSFMLMKPESINYGV